MCATAIAAAGSTLYLIAYAQIKARITMLRSASVGVFLVLCDTATGVGITADRLDVVGEISPMTMAVAIVLT